MQHIFRFVKIGVFIALLASILSVVTSVTGSMAGTRTDPIDLQHTIGKLARTADGALMMVKKAIDEAEREHDNAAANNAAPPASSSAAPVVCPAGYTCQPIVPDPNNHNNHK